MERIQKIIANSGYCSRRKAEELIKAGKVKLNGEVIRELGTKANYSDQKIALKIPNKSANKPAHKAYLIFFIPILPKYKVKI